jgi:teichuronic acid biosynthesis glycosyltransferase TuaC
MRDNSYRRSGADEGVNLRALIVTPIYPWPGNPQEGVFVHNQVMNLARLGLQCRVLAYRAGPPRCPNWLVHRVNSHYQWQGFNWPRQYGTVTVGYAFHPRGRSRKEDIVPTIGEALVKFIDSHPEYLETDIVYSQWLWSGGAASLILRQQFGWPVVAIARGGEMQQWHEMHPHCRPHVEKVIREADRILANCEGLRQQAERLVPGSASRISVVYNGCDASRFRPATNKIAIRRTLGLKENCKLLLFCGSIEEVKGIAELADAWSRFSPSHRDWSLVVVGRTI